MRRGFLKSIAALAVGAGAAWGQDPVPLGPAGPQPAAVSPGGGVIPAGQGPVPTLMPPVTVGPAGDPLGLGPTAGLGPPPGPMYPPPGPYAAPLFQPAPPTGHGGGSGYGAAPHVWLGGEYMLLFARHQPIAFPLLTTSSPNQNGLLGAPTTVALVPARGLDYGAINGFRLNGGFFGDADRRFGFDMTGFYSEEAEYDRRFFADAIGSVGIPVLARPFIDTTTGPTSLVVVSPSITGTAPSTIGTTVGRARVASTTNTWSLEPSAVLNLYRSNPGRRLWMSLDVLSGYKHLEFHETLEIHTSSFLDAGVTVTPIFTTGPFGIPIQTGTRITPATIGVAGVTTQSPATVNISDKFVATNRFNGANFALRGEVRYGMFTLTTVGKIAVGNMHQMLRIRGLTYFENPVTQANGYAVAGLFANSSNIGTFSNDETAIVPEMTLTLGINLTKSLSMYLGYNIIYIDKVARPGNQLNPLINAATVPFHPTYGSTTAVPGGSLLFVQDDFMLHGLSAGFSFRY